MGSLREECVRALTGAVCRSAKECAGVRMYTCAGEMRDKCKTGFTVRHCMQHAT
jgi:hypothetical protein